MKLEGLVAATFSPMKEDGSLNLAQVPGIVEHLISSGVAGAYVCGSTGEGPSLSKEERKAVAQAYVEAIAGRMPVIVQVGHNSLVEAQDLAAHAQAIGADALSAVPPSYFKPDSLDTLISCLAEVTSAAPELPFYYYHIPRLSSVDADMVDFLKAGEKRLPTLAGIKFSDRSVETLQACMNYAQGRYQLFFGVDEMLLTGFAAGVKASVGSTFNFAAPIYLKVIEAFKRGDIDAAREAQLVAVEMVRVLLRYKGLAGIKAMMKIIGQDCGPSRLPVPTLDDAQRNSMHDELKALGLFLE